MSSIYKGSLSIKGKFSEIKRFVDDIIECNNIEFVVLGEEENYKYYCLFHNYLLDNEVMDIVSPYSDVLIIEDGINSNTRINIESVVGVDCADISSLFSGYELDVVCFLYLDSNNTIKIRYVGGSCMDMDNLGGLIQYDNFC